MGRTLVQGILPTVKKTVPKPHMRRPPRFSGNCRATGKKIDNSAQLYSNENPGFQKAGNGKCVKTME
jgi:hypothetical protein